MSALTLIRNTLIPVLTSNTSDSDITLSSTDYNSSYPAYKAFDGTNANSVDCWVSSNATDRYLQVQFSDYKYINGLIFTSRNTTIPAQIYNSDYDLYISNDAVTWTKIATFGSPSTSDTDKQILFTKVQCKYIKLVPIDPGYVAIGKLNFYYVEEFFALKQDSKYYSFHPNQYDTTAKLFKEVTAQNLIDSITSEGILAEKYYLTSQMSINGETFVPIDKFGDKFQLISVKNLPASVYGLKSTRQLVVAKSDFSAKIAEHIDNFNAVYTLSANCSIKMVVSIDSGTTWLTTADNGTTWTKLVDTATTPLTTVADTNWNAVKDSIFAGGFDITNIANINFNTLSTNIQTMRFAYVFDITGINDNAINTSLSWQFDARGLMKLLSASDVDIVLRQYEIVVTPKTDMDLLKINVGTGGPVTINNYNEVSTDTITNDDISNMVSGVWS
jgi:hypothetical protein